MSILYVYFWYVLHVSTKGLCVSIMYVLHVSTRILYMLILHGYFLCSTCIYENLTCVDIACIFSYVLHVSTRNLNVSFLNVYFLYVLHVSTKGLYVSITYVLHVSMRILYMLILHGHFFCMQLYCRVVSSMYQQEFFVCNGSVESIEQLKLHGHLKSSGPKKDQE